MKSLRNIALMAGLLACLSSYNARAGERGADGSGGGSSIESAFRLRASFLIQKIETSHEAKSYCPPVVMQAGLDSTKIRVLDAFDSRTVPAIQNNGYEAWTVPGDMQLLAGPWSKLLDPAKSGNTRSTDALIIHEVYRTTKVCDDDQFVLSARVIAALDAAGILGAESFVLSFKHVVGQYTSPVKTLSIELKKTNLSGYELFGSEDIKSGEVVTRITVGKSAKGYHVSLGGYSAGPLYHYGDTTVIFQTREVPKSVVELPLRHLSEWGSAPGDSGNLFIANIVAKLLLMGPQN